MINWALTSFLPLAIVNSPFSSSSHFSFIKREKRVSDISDYFAFQPSEPPGPPNITSSGDDIQATSLTVRWTAPANDGGRAVTGYRVRVLQASDVVKNVSCGDIRELVIGTLDVNTTYTLEVYARNVAGEGPPGTKTVTTKYEGTGQCTL